MCGEWNTLKEIKVQKSNIKNDRRSSEIKIEKITDIKTENSSRVSTKIGELDRVLGGGIVPGSLILLVELF